METGLQLLMRDGAMRVAFRPHLAADQYTELLRAVNIAETKNQLAAVVKRLAEKWNIAVEADSVLEPSIGIRRKSGS